VYQADKVEPRLVHGELNDVDAILNPPRRKVGETSRFQVADERVHRLVRSHLYRRGVK
jgi:hypothetical protein